MAQKKEEKAQGELSIVFTYLKGGCKEDGARLLSVVPIERTRGNGPNLKHGRLPLNIRKHMFNVRATEHWHNFPRGIVQSPSLWKSESYFDVI